MIVLFEGIDKSGKSSLIRELSKLIPCRYYKNLIKPVDTVASGNQMVGIYRALYQRALSEPDYYHFFDRSHFTEMIYGSVLRNYKPADLFDWHKFEIKHLKEIIVIYVKTNTGVLVQRFVENKEDFLSIEHIPNIYTLYNAVFFTTNLQVLTVRGDEPIDKAIDSSMQFIIKSQKEYEHSRRKNNS